VVVVVVVVVVVRLQMMDWGLVDDRDGILLVEMVSGDSLCQVVLAKNAFLHVSCVYGVFIFIMIRLVVVVVVVVVVMRKEEEGGGGNTTDQNFNTTSNSNFQSTS